MTQCVRVTTLCWSAQHRAHQRGLGRIASQGL